MRGGSEGYAALRPGSVAGPGFGWINRHLKIVV